MVDANPINEPCEHQGTKCRKEQQQQGGRRPLDAQFMNPCVSNENIWVGQTKIKTSPLSPLRHQQHYHHRPDLQARLAIPLQPRETKE